MEFRKNQVRNLIPLREVKLDFTNQLFIQIMGEFQYTGGTPITPRFPVGDEYMQKMVQHTHNAVLRQMFGKKSRKDKQSKPLIFCFFENSSRTATRHIHTIMNFPKSIIHRCKEYLDRFAKYWIEKWTANKDADRDFWFEEVRDQDAITRYVKKKMIANNEEWFVLD